MQAGIIGLPQVGKTTLFRILTKAHVDQGKGGQETRVGVAKVPEPRLVELAKLYHPKKITMRRCSMSTSVVCRRNECASRWLRCARWIRLRM